MRSARERQTAIFPSQQPSPLNAMTLTKRLLIRASNCYDSDGSVLPVNTGEPVEITSLIGKFSVSVFIRNFDGSEPHRLNSLYNVGDSKFIDGQEFSNFKNDSIGDIPNLRIVIKFTPSQPVKGSDLLFGNDCTTSIKEYVPTTLLATGLKFFTWFINLTMKGDVYSQSPYLYAPALNSFSRITLLNGLAIGSPSADENLNDNNDNALQIPKQSKERIKFFCKIKNCEDFVFNDASDYNFSFDTNFLRMADSNYHVAIPTYGNRTFDINVLRYANENLNNFNWVMKYQGDDGIQSGTTGLVLNFSLRDEESSEN